MNRAYFKLKFMSTSDGVSTGATYGFKNMIISLLKNNPTINHLCVCFDQNKYTLRHRIYDKYKANRNHNSKDKKYMYSQVNHIVEFIEAYGLKFLFSGDFEADDVINTIVLDQTDNFEIIEIYSSDKDLLQLVNGKVSVINTSSSNYRNFNPMMVEGKFGVEPKHMIDLLSIMGDTSDNIPGCRGIGQKGAVKLVREFGTIEEIKEKLKNKADSRSIKFMGSIRDIELSKQLIRLMRVESVPKEKDYYRIGKIDKNRLNKLFNTLEFRDLF